jgi:outer membrane protein OmpA-like peptidoglycan-associated protein
LRRLSVLLACAALAGCASAGSVALLNDEGGGAGAVAVLDPATGTARGELTEANTQSALGGRVRPRPLTTNYDALLAVMPSAAKVFTLYFVDGTRLTPESAQTLEELRRLVTPASEVQITGHTDTTGDTISNDKLSLDRAAEVRSALVAQGLPVGNARVTGRGERELLKPTADGVNEPVNRRVQVIIR